VRLATVRLGGRYAAVRLDEETAVELGAPDVGAFLTRHDWPEAALTAAGPAHPVADLDYAPVIPAPEKIICVGLNYRSHIVEMGHDPPSHPTLFAKYAPALVGAYDEIVLPAESDRMDWEAELAVVIGRRVRRADPEAARQAIAGWTLCNDVTARDWQARTSQWLQGKTFESTTPLGPWLLTAEGADADLSGRPLTCTVDGDEVQRGDVADLVFGPADLVAYVSTVLTLSPGDVISTGTPAGVGHGRRPPRYLQPSNLVVTAMPGLGECANRCRRAALPG
jgi:acylpyruvate hydrolase